MKTRRALVILFLMSMLFSQRVSASSAGITNPSFEMDSGWVFLKTGLGWWGEYDNSWATQGTRSYLIGIAWDNGEPVNPGKDTYAQISEQVDLTGIPEIMFDLRTTGTWDVDEVDYLTFEVLVDYSVVYTSEHRTGIFTGQKAPVAGFDGRHTLSLRIRNHEDFDADSPATRGFFIDNLRLVTHKTYLPTISRPTTCLGVPTLIAPANDSTLNTLLPTFQYDDGKYPGATESWMFVSTSNAFDQNSGAVRGTGQNGLITFKSMENLAPATKYYWHAYIKCGTEAGDYSPTWSFTSGSGGVLLPAPSLSSPADGSTLPGSQVTVKWAAVSGAKQYLLKYHELGAFVTFGMFTTDTQADLTTLKPSTQYEWYVTAINDYAYGTESAHWKFTTGAGSSLDNADCGRWFVQSQDGTITSCEGNK